MVSGFIEIDMAQSIRMSHDWYPRVVLNRFHKTVASAGNDQVNVAVKIE
jgi:hypothetical protein